MVKTRKQLVQEQLEKKDVECVEGAFGVDDVVVMEGLNPVYLERTVYGPGQKPKLQIQHTKNIDELDNIFLENVVDIPKKLLHDIIEDTDNLAEELSKAMLRTILPQALAFDQASAYVEAVAKDGLNTPITIEDDVLSGLAPLSRLSIIYSYIERLQLPKTLKTHILYKLADAAVEDSTKAMQSKGNNRKYSQRLRELAGVIRGGSNQKTDMAFLRKRSIDRGKK